MIDDSKPGQKLGSFTLASADDFSYKDPIDGRWAQSAARFHSCSHCYARSCRLD